VKCNAGNVVGSAQTLGLDVGRRGRLVLGIHVQETFSEDVAGRIALTVMPSLANSIAAVRMNPNCAALLVP
jgi:hypothetical protein